MTNWKFDTFCATDRPQATFWQIGTPLKLLLIKKLNSDKVFCKELILFLKMPIYFYPLKTVVWKQLFFAHGFWREKKP